MSSPLNIQALSDAIRAELENYSEEVGEKLERTAREVAKEGVNKLENNSPKGVRGKYKKSWQVSKTSKKNGRYRKFNNYINNKEYRLTHLLEKGHATRNGGWVSAQVHIAPVEAAIIEKYESETRRLLTNGG